MRRFLDRVPKQFLIPISLHLTVPTSAASFYLGNGKELDGEQINLRWVKNVWSFAHVGFAHRLAARTLL